MRRRVQTGLWMGMEQDRVLFQKHWVIYLMAGLLNLGLVLWACLGSAQALTPENAGRLFSLEYSYGSFFGGYMDFTLERQADGQLYLRAVPGNGLELSVYAPVGDEVLDEITALLEAEAIFAWDGFVGENDDVLDGFSFGLLAEFEQGTLTAGGYEQYPAGFDQGHAALSGYLWNLAERLRPTRLSGPEDIQGVTLHYPALNLRLFISPASTTYYHGRTSDTHSGDEMPPELMEAFLQDAVDFYNAGGKGGGTGCAFSMEVRAVVDGAETVLSLRAAAEEERTGNVQTPLEEKALALVGRPADFVGSEEFALETYQNAFVYTGLLVWDPEGLGEVRIDLPGRTVTVNGKVYEVSQEIMQRFSDAVGSQSLRLAFVSDANRIEKIGVDPLYDALVWWEELPKADYGWLFGVAHVNGYTIFAYGGEMLPSGWAEQVRAPVQGLLEETK